LKRVLGGAKLTAAGDMDRRCTKARGVHTGPAPACGRSSMAERQLPKLHTRVRFPSPAPTIGMFLRSSRTGPPVFSFHMRPRQTPACHLASALAGFCKRRGSSRVTAAIVRNPKQCKSPPTLLRNASAGPLIDALLAASLGAEEIATMYRTRQQSCTAMREHPVTKPALRRVIHLAIEIRVFRCRPGQKQPYLAASCALAGAAGQAISLLAIQPLYAEQGIATRTHSPSLERPAVRILPLAV
jgi:hypothetical protein